MKQGLLRRGTEPNPDGYPDTYERMVRLADGRRVSVRPILPSDAPELADAIRTADPETLHARFLGAPPPITPATLDRLTRVDYVHHFALVARARKRGVAIARYIASAPSEDGTVTAEVAIAVAPGWRRIGLATALLKLLEERAAECGISTITATYLATNRAVTELARAGHAEMLIADGVAEMRAQLPDAETTAPTDPP